MSEEKKDLLAPVRELLADPARWTKGCGAKDRNDRPVSARDPRAVCWCLYGAYVKMYPMKDEPSYLHRMLIEVELVRRVKEARIEGVWGFTDEVAFNDWEYTTHADVMRLLEEPLYAHG